MILQIIHKEGYKGFFRGTTLSIIKNTIAYTLFFTGIENFQAPKHYGIMLQSALNFGIAAFSKLVGTMLVTPLAVMKTKMQIVGSSEYTGILDCAKKIKNNEGYHGFYKGLIPTILKDVPYTGV